MISHRLVVLKGERRLLKSSTEHIVLDTADILGEPFQRM